MMTELRRHARYSQLPVIPLTYRFICVASLMKGPE